ncbi:MAG: flagellar motor protein MotB [Desulfobacteraceae bacterium]
MKQTLTSDSLISRNDTTEWLVTYADLMTLLLVFFVLLYSLKSFEQEKFKSAVETIREQINADVSLTGVMELMEIPDSLDTRITIEDVTGLRSIEKSIVKDINAFIRNKDQADNIATSLLENKIVVRIKGKALFKSGSADLNQNAVPIFNEIMKIIFDYPRYKVNIKGHTDNVPISTARYPSNWELSAIRATTVLKHLVERGIDPKRLTATGYGDIMPLVPNNSDKNRAINRRVEFVLEKTTKQR